MTEATFRKLAILGVIAAAILWLGTELFRTVWLAGDEPRAVTPRGELAQFETTAAQVFEAATPSVVYIFTERARRSAFGQTAFEQGTGSGFVWDRAGHIITNDHVIQNADKVYVQIDKGSPRTARVIGSSADHDLAVLRISDSATELVPIPIGESRNLRIGQATFAIGNPFGLTRTLTTGVVSALDRELPTKTGSEITGVIQTDAAINPGNSGGPLLDSAARLIGVNTAIVSGTGSYSGVGFAVPVDTVNRVVPQLIARGRPVRPGIGIQAGTPQISAQLGVDGIVVFAVVPGSPADRAGLRAVDRTRQTVGDIILAVNGEPVSTVSNLVAALEEIGAGKAATLKILRGNQVIDVKVDVVDIG